MGGGRRRWSFRNSRRTLAWLWTGSCASYSRVSRDFWRRPSSTRRSCGRLASSLLYSCTNVSHREGWCPNHLRSAALGATSRSQRSKLSCTFARPRGQSRSTSTRTPSVAAGASRARLITMSARMRGPSCGGNASSGARMPGTTTTPSTAETRPDGPSMQAIFHRRMEEVQRHLLPVEYKEIASIFRGMPDIQATAGRGDTARTQPIHGLGGSHA